MSIVSRLLRGAGTKPAAAPQWSPDAQIEAHLQRGASWPASLPEPGTTLQPAYLLEPASRAELLDRLRRFGIVCLPGAIGGALLARLREEFEQVMLDPESLGASVDRSGDSLNVRVLRESMDRGRLPAIHAFFSSAWMDALCTQYFGGEPHLLNSEIFVHQTEATQAPPSGALHLDRRQTLKFWIYPDDMPLECGPMRIVPGSHLRHRVERERFMAGGRPLDELDNVLRESDGEAVPIVGPAGTLFIQDTDAGHGASPVAPGRRRRIMRGHCRLQRVHDWASEHGA